MEREGASVAKQAMVAEFSEARIGQFCALTVALAFIGAAVWIAISGHPWAGAFLGSGGVGLQLLVRTFVRGRQSDKNREQQAVPSSQSTRKSGKTPS